MATIKQRKAFKKVVENGGNVSKAMVATGYSKATAKTPQKLTESKGWFELSEEFLSNTKVLAQHAALLNATKIEHMVFPLGPKGEDDPNLSGGNPNAESDEDADPEASMPEEHKERTSLTDEEIIAMLAEVNCKVKRIVHGETARHVYFWAADNKGRKDAIDMAYKVKGLYAPEKSVSLKLTADLKANVPPDKQEEIRRKYNEELRLSYLPTEP